MPYRAFMHFSLLERKEEEGEGERRGVSAEKGEKSRGRGGERRGKGGRGRDPS